MITDRLTSAFAAAASSSQSQQSQNRHCENNVAFRKKNKRTGALVCAGVHLVTNSTYPGEALIRLRLSRCHPLPPAACGYHYGALVASRIIIAARV